MLFHDVRGVNVIRQSQLEGGAAAGAEYIWMMSNVDGRRRNERNNGAPLGGMNPRIA